VHRELTGCCYERVFAAPKCTQSATRGQVMRCLRFPLPKFSQKDSPGVALRRNNFLSIFVCHFCRATALQCLNLIYIHFLGIFEIKIKTELCVGNRKSYRVEFTLFLQGPRIKAFWAWFWWFFDSVTNSVAPALEGSSPYSQEPATCHYPEPTGSNLHSPSQSP
jgi:hypothetical protein